MPNDEPFVIYTKPSLQLWAWVVSGAVFAGLIIYDVVRFPVAPWGDKKDENKIKATALNGTLAVGDRICIDLHAGALGLRWYKAARCP